MSHVLQWMQLYMSIYNASYVMDSSDLLLRIDLESHSKRFVVIFHVLVNTSRAEPTLNTLVLWPLELGVLIPVLDLQMYWLVFFVICTGPAYARQDVKTDLSVRLRVLYFLRLICKF